MTDKTEHWCPVCGLGRFSNDGHRFLCVECDEREPIAPDVVAAIKADALESFARCREKMADELSADKGLYTTYQANVAMTLYDRFQGADWKDPGTRNRAADDILSLVFGIPPSAPRALAKKERDL